MMESKHGFIQWTKHVHLPQDLEYGFTVMDKSLFFKLVQGNHRQKFWLFTRATKHKVAIHHVTNTETKRTAISWLFKRCKMLRYVDNSEVKVAISDDATHATLFVPKDMYYKLSHSDFKSWRVRMKEDLKLDNLNIRSIKKCMITKRIYMNYL